MFESFKKQIFGIVLLTLLIGCSTSNTWKSYLGGRDVGALQRAFLQIVQDTNGDLWAVNYGDGNVYFYERTEDNWIIQFSPHRAGLGSAQTLAIGINGDIWVGTRTGLGRYQPDSDEWLIYEANEDLFNKDIRAIVQDQKGKLWVGTGGDGVFTSTDNGNSWQHVVIEEGFSYFTVHDIFQDSKGSLWVAGDALYRYEPQMDRWTIFTDGELRVNSNLGIRQASGRERTILLDDFVFSMTEDQDGFLWFGTLTAGIARYDEAKDQWSFLTVADGLIDNEVQAIALDESGRLLFGTDEGLSLYDPINDHWKSYNDENGFTDHTVTDILLDNRGVIWITTFGAGIFGIEAKNL